MLNDEFQVTRDLLAQSWTQIQFLSIADHLQTELAWPIKVFSESQEEIKAVYFSHIKLSQLMAF